VVAASTTFGRKRPSGAAPPRNSTEGLSPQAEAFRAQLRSNPGKAEDDFADWSRATRPGRWMAWATGLALMSPGLLCFLFQAPLPVSIGLEIAGGVANAWLRRERRRHLRAIANWNPPAAD
jgi:hypothetical protein